MFLGELLGRPVLQAGRRVGYVNDVRLFVPDRTEGQLVGTPRVYGVAVCPQRSSAFLGYERARVSEPKLLAAFFMWRSRGSFLVRWADVLEWGDAGVEVSPDAERWSTSL